MMFCCWMREWDFTVPAAHDDSYKPLASPHVLEIRLFKVDTLRKLLELRHQNTEVD